MRMRTLSGREGMYWDAISGLEGGERLRDKRGGGGRGSLNPILGMRPHLGDCASLLQSKLHPRPSQVVLTPRYLEFHLSQSHVLSAWKKRRWI